MELQQLKLITGGRCPLTPVVGEGYLGSLIPHTFESAHGFLTVVDILDQWLGSSCEYYKIKTATESLLIVRHDVETDKWEITKWFD